MRDEPIANGAETIMGKKNVSDIERGAGFFQGFTASLMDVARERRMSFEAIYRLATPAGRATLERMVKVAYDDWLAEQQKSSVKIIDASGTPYRGGANGKNIIVVPDMAAVDLTALVIQELNLTPDELRWYEEWDYYLDMNRNPISGRGKSFKWDLWKPGCKISSDEVREYFKARGFYGHAGAFTQWCRVYGLQGHHASIPDYKNCMHVYRQGHSEFVPSSSINDDERELRGYGAFHSWPEYWSFVGFSELPA